LTQCSNELSNDQGAISIAPYRYAACVEYAGAAYKGWQTQKEGNVPTVQQSVEKALSKIANHPVQVVCAGRTDAGVNGTYQIIHFDTHAQREERSWVLGCNTHLPDDIAIHWVQPVSEEFHARFSAQERRYRYLILSQRVKPAVLSKGITWTYKSLDVDAMHAAGQHLVGEHDFTSYRAVQCQAKSPVRTIKALSVYQKGQVIVLDVTANAFLHHMVRNIAGVLMTIGAGEAPQDWSKTVLDARDRREGGITAPPWGLYFVDVKYPSEFNLPASALGPYFL
jgi:tRNA pseudouridine38-40 synthase